MSDQGSGIGDQGSGIRPKKRSWIPIVIGIFLLIAVVAVGAIVLTAMWFRESMTITRSSEDSATQQFEDVRRRFPGQEPLIQLVDGRPQFAADRASEAVPAVPLTSIHVIAYDRDEGNTVTFSLPFWLIGGAIGFSIAISLLAGSYPAARAAKLDPIQVLRHD